MVSKGRSTRVNRAPRSVAQVVKSILESQRETKFQSETVAATLAVNGTVYDLTQNIAEGDSSTTRDGLQINMAKLKIRFEALLNTAASTDFVRLLIFQDTQSNGVAPTVAELLVSADPNAMLNNLVLVQKRFKILLDKTWSMVTGSATRAIQFTRDINMKGVKISYLGGTDATAANGKNSCWALVISDEATQPGTFVLDVGMLFHDS